MTIKMHKEEIEVDSKLVRRLLASQFPHWASLSLKRIQSAGTDNAIFRLGSKLSVRLPRIHWAVAQVEKEQYWLPKLAPYLPLKISTPVAMGEPSDKYPYPWSIYRWCEGENATLDQIVEPCQAAIDLAQFLLALQQIDTSGGPPPFMPRSRGLPLITRDAAVRQAIGDLDGLIDTNAATVIWESALQAPNWERDPVWYHGDLLTGNLLFRDGKLHAVIDFGLLGVGDPACDLMIAWGLFAGESRIAFRDALGVDDATWARGRGHALAQALVFIPYYLHTNPIGVGYARHTLDAIFAEFYAERVIPQPRYLSGEALL